MGNGFLLIFAIPPLWQVSNGTWPVIYLFHKLNYFFLYIAGGSHVKLSRLKNDRKVRHPRTT